MRSFAGFLTVIAFVLPTTGTHTAVAGPVPPCAGEPVPAFGPADGPPQARTWSEGDLRAEHWQPPACLGWSADARLVAAVASRFHSGDDVFHRIAAITAFRSIRYWSISRQQWRPLALSAIAVDATGKPIGDVPADGLLAGRDTMFVERNENSGEATYRLSVRERSAERMVVVTENITPIKVSIVTAFEPGTLQTVAIVQREGGGLWSTWQATRVGSAGSSLVLSHPGSFLNRLEAIRRYLAGLPTDRDPPIALR